MNNPYGIMAMIYLLFFGMMDVIAKQPTTHLNDSLLLFAIFILLLGISNYLYEIVSTLKKEIPKREGD